MTDMITRAATSLGSLNVEERTVDVIFASEQPVRRRSWETGSYDEVLLCGRENVDLSRADNMSLLDSHGAYDLNDRLGAVVPGSVRFEKGQVIAKVKLSRRAKAEELFNDLKDGMSLPVSVGYRIAQEETTEPEPGGVAIVRATRWQPLEISVVPIPADHNAKTRGFDMPQTQTTPEPQTRGEVLKERKRVSDLTFLARSAKITDTELDAAIEAGTSADEFRRRALDAMIERQDQSPTFPIVETRDVDGGNGNRRQAMADALQTRINPSHTPKADARQYCNLSLIELAREVLQGDGVNVRGLSKGEIAERALHTTSDFAIVLAETGKALLQKSYDAEPSGIKRVARASTIDDFRPKRSVRLSDWPDLKKVNEHGEFTRGTVYESEESYRLQTYGRVIGFTRQLLINDSLGAFTEPSKQFGRSAARLEADILADLVVSNPKMGDGKALFHSDHKNILPAAALSVDSVAAARTAIRKQVDDQGKPASLRAKFLIVPPDLEMEGEKILAAIAAARTEDVNVNAGRLELVVEDRLVDPKAWFLAVDPESIESLEYSYLTGEPGPQFAERIGFDVDGVEYKCRLDFGAGFLGWRGWYRSAGV
ncbi:prohead protease/major capsid protein fusion protein [Agrobacterium rosae]|uniref:prohead protease/major capsid protein fusion protein n=1 Tax=Agrobacterium rosae TaxID=1972867 RepID=UPI0020332932|nr:prohead protease/major capsid protein fusion protein [Agrobacterium rosae]MCM2435364.1 peptidase U35 [Agrobacterium rosae]